MKRLALALAAAALVACAPTEPPAPETRQVDLAEMFNPDMTPRATVQPADNIHDFLKSIAGERDTP